MNVIEEYTICDLIISNQFTLNYLNSQTRRVLAIASFIFGCLALSYAICRYSFEAKQLDGHHYRVDSLEDLHSLSESGSNRFGVYVSANDFDIQSSKKEMSSLCPPNGVHIGCSGWHNLDIMAFRKSSLGIMVDINANNKKFIDLTHQTITEATDRMDFVDKMVQNLRKSSIAMGEDVFNRSPEERIRDQLQSPGSWLGDDESFEYIQNQFKQSKIVAITMDLCQEEKFKAIAEFLKNHQLAVDTLYLCNVRFFINGPQQSKFATSLNHIIQDDAYVIHCPHILSYPYLNEIRLPINWQRNSRRQCVTRGKDLKNNPALYFVRHAKDAIDKNVVRFEDLQDNC